MKTLVRNKYTPIDKLAPVNPMRHLYGRLKNSGYDPGYIRQFVLPDWWDDEAALQPDGYMTALISIARGLKIDIGHLESNIEPLVPVSANRLFFRRQGDTDADLSIAASIAEASVKVALYGTLEQDLALPNTPEEVRQEILRSGAQSIDVPALLNYCWGHGIPVLHVAKFPVKVHKMVGFAVCQDGRSAIVLSSSRKKRAWQLFTLAHELGHIVLGHLKDGISILDQEEQLTGNEDPKEAEANDFAMRLVFGVPSLDITVSGRAIKPWDVSDFAREYALAKRVNVGVLTLQYGRYIQGKVGTSDAEKQEAWKISQTALKSVEPTDDGVSIIQAEMMRRIDWEEISDDSKHFLLRVTQVETRN
jgi:Zn-dependent peptidase ImmA (M78 family)